MDKYLNLTCDYDSFFVTNYNKTTIFGSKRLVLMLIKIKKNSYVLLNQLKHKSPRLTL